MNEVATGTCTLRLAARAGTEQCPRERCAFWEPGGAVADAGCLIERLGLDVRRPELAAYLLELRERLDEVRDRREAADLHRRLVHRIGLEL
jgi:hypothetical protein